MDKDYEPFGEEWERAMMKSTKKNLIDMVGRIQTRRFQNVEDVIREFDEELDVVLHSHLDEHENFHDCFHDVRITHMKKDLLRICNDFIRKYCQREEQ